jgi:ParB-like chromosome segregation protein Spo0J
MKKTAPPAVRLAVASELTPSPHNARRHSPDQVAQIRASIEEFGFTKPILVSAGEIVAGHGTTLAALSIYEDGGVITLPGGQELPAGTVPVLEVSGWTEAQRRAYILGDNAIAENSDWDEAMRGIELAFLESEGFNLDLTGFDPKTIQADLSALEARGGFLSDLAAGSDGEAREKANRNGSSSSTVNLTFAVSPAERDKIIDWLATERKARGLPTNAAALAALAREGLE